MMRRLAVFLAIAGLPTMARAQMHVVKKPETVVRAVGVFEWTGEEAKPTASRLVPVSVFINGQLEDAGIYMARPVPFALGTGTIFEVQTAGVADGTLELAYDRHVEGNGTVPIDNGWTGYGLFKPAAAPSPVLATKKSGPLPQVVASGGSKPRLGNRTEDSDNKTADDSSRPTMKRRTDPTSPDPPASSDPTAAKTPASSPATPTASDDPDRPVLQRRSDSSDTSPTDATPTESSGSASTDDKSKPTMRRRTPDSPDSTNTSSTDSGDEADRPTLKKRTQAPQGKGQKRPGDTASVQNAVGSLNDDPDRPTLQRGAPSHGADTKGIPPLNGLPADMKQRVAISDAQNRAEHDFNRQWDSETERADVMAKMQEIARARLAKYDMPAPAAATAATAVVAPPAAKAVVRGKKPLAVAVPPAPVALFDEQLRGFTLSYGGAATFVYTASSPGVDGTTRYVSVVAQREAAGQPKVALASITDSKHLDRTPWMRLVDVVDADASNRASLLFELRAQNARQFALYRVIGAATEQVFQSGTTE